MEHIGCGRWTFSFFGRSIGKFSTRDASMRILSANGGNSSRAKCCRLTLSANVSGFLVGMLSPASIPSIATPVEEIVVLDQPVELNNPPVMALPGSTCSVNVGPMVSASTGIGDQALCVDVRTNEGALFLLGFAEVINVGAPSWLGLVEVINVVAPS